MVFGGWGAMAAMLAGGGMVWLVNQINPYANKTAIVLAGLAIFAVGWVFNKTDIVSGPRLTTSMARGWRSHGMAE